MVFIILFFGISASSSAAVLIRLCDAHPLVIAAYRMAIAAAILIPFALAKHRQETLHLARKHTIAVFGSGLLLALHFATWISSLSHTSVASSAFLVTTNPVFVGLGTWLLLREPPSLYVILGTVVALGGTAWISYADFVSSEHALFGDALAVLGAIMISGHLLIGRQLRRSVGLTPYITTVYATAAIILLCIAALSGESLVSHAPRDFLLFFVLAAGPQLLGHTSFNYALKSVSASLLVLLMLVEPVLSSYLAYLVLGEPPAAEVLVGGSLILFGIAFALLRENRT